MSDISRDQERDLITALEYPMVMMILAQLCAGILQRATQPTVNNTQPIFSANNFYNKAINEVLVQYLTVPAVQEYFETTFLSDLSMFMLYEKKVSLILMTWRNLTIRNSKLLFEV